MTPYPSVVSSGGGSSGLQSLNTAGKQTGNRPRPAEPSLVMRRVNTPLIKTIDFFMPISVLHLCRESILIRKHDFIFIFFCENCLPWAGSPAEQRSAQHSLPLQHQPCDSCSWDSDSALSVTSVHTSKEKWKERGTSRGAWHTAVHNSITSGCRRKSLAQNTRAANIIAPGRAFATLELQQQTFTPVLFLWIWSRDGKSLRVNTDAVDYQNKEKPKQGSPVGIQSTSQMKTGVTESQSRSRSLTPAARLQECQVRHF